MENSEFPYAFFNGSIYNCMLTNHGFYESKMPISNSNPSTGQYGMPVSECGGSRYFFTDIDSYGGGILWDAQTITCWHTATSWMSLLCFMRT